MDNLVARTRSGGGAELQVEEDNSSVLDFGFQPVSSGNASALSEARRQRHLFEALRRGRFTLQPLFLFNYRTSV